jgi:hypothetical protein
VDHFIGFAGKHGDTLVDRSQSPLVDMPSPRWVRLPGPC